MRGRRRADGRGLAILALVAGLLGGACSPSAAASPSTVTGIVTNVDSSGGGLGGVRGFTLRDGAGKTWTFALGQLENASSFPPGHLGEHRITAEPVRVWYRVENGQDVAYRIEDAGASAT